MSAECTAAIFDAHVDTAEMLQCFLQECGFNAVMGYRFGRSDLDAFLACHRPDAVICDIEPPYGPNWHALTRLTETGCFSVPGLIITTTAPEYLRACAGPAIRQPEIVAKPYAPADLVGAVVRALARSRQLSMPSTPFTGASDQATRPSRLR